MRHFSYRHLDELRLDAERRTGSVRFVPEAEAVRRILARPVRIGKWTAGNSIVIQPMEGCDGTADGSPDVLTTRRYERFASAGAKVIWFEATAVRAEGRANPRQLWLHESNVDSFARLYDHTLRMHLQHHRTADDLIIPIQLTHSGCFSFPEPVCIKASEWERLEDEFVAAAGFAHRAGFRAVDIKATHGYLISELLGRRELAMEVRVAPLRNIVRKIRARFGNSLLMAVRLGCYDGAAGSWGVDASNPGTEDLREVKQLIAWLIEDGVELLNVSMGCPYVNPHVLRPFEKPDEGNYEQPEHPLVGIDRHFRIAGELQRCFPNLPVVGSGYSWLQKYAINAAAHNLADGRIALFGMGRNALAHPNFAREALAHGEVDENRVCKTLTYCTYLMRQKHHPLGQYPTGCPPFDKLMYGPIIKEARAARRQINESKHQQ